MPRKRIRQQTRLLGPSHIQIKDGVVAEMAKIPKGITSHKTRINRVRRNRIRDNPKTGIRIHKAKDSRNLIQLRRNL